MSEQEELEALLAAEVNTEAPEIDASSDDAFYGALSEYARLRDQLDKVSKVKSDLEKAIENMAQALVPVFEARRLKSIRLQGVGLISTAANNNPKVVDQDRLFAWLEEQGEEGIIKRQVNYMTLKGFLNARIEDGKPLPGDDVVELTSGRILKLSREKKGK